MLWSVAYDGRVLQVLYTVLQRRTERRAPALMWVLFVVRAVPTTGWGEREAGPKARTPPWDRSLADLDSRAEGGGRPLRRGAGRGKAQLAREAWGGRGSGTLGGPPSLQSGKSELGGVQGRVEAAGPLERRSGRVHP